MKNSAFTWVTAAAAVVIFSRCHQETDDNAVHNTYFWTSVPTEKQELTLFVDGQQVGPLPYFSTELTCSNDSLKARALNMTLRSGKYQIEARNSQGVVRSDGSIKISESGLGVGPGPHMNNPGGVTAAKETPNAVSPEKAGNSCVIVNLFY